MTKKIIIPKAYKDLFNPQYRYKCWYGGRGGAKSESIARALLVIASSKKCRILCTREIQNSIKDSVYKLLADLIELYELPGFRVLKDSISHANGSEFIFKGLYNNIQSIKSVQDINICWVEEAQTISKESLNVLLPTIRAKGSEIWFSFNRLEDDDPIWTELCENPDGKTLVKQVNYDANPFFPEVLEDERLRCQKFKPDDYMHIWLGEPEKQAGGLVVKNFTDENIKHINYQPDIPIHITTDFNCDPMAWHLAHVDWITEKVFFFDEIVIENTTTTKTVDEFHSRMIDYGNGKANFDQKIIINGDASGSNRSTQSEYANYALMRNRLSALGYRDIEIKLRESNGLIRNRVLAWNEKIIDIEGNRKIIISPKCKYLIMNCKKLKYKEGTREIDIPSPSAIKKNKELKFLSHPFDSASYLINTYFPIRREK